MDAVEETGWVEETRKRLRDDHEQRERERNERAIKDRHVRLEWSRRQDEACSNEYPNYKSDMAGAKEVIKGTVMLLQLDEIVWVGCTQEAIIMGISLECPWKIDKEKQSAPGFPFRQTCRIAWTDFPGSDRYRLLRIAADEITTWARQAGLEVSTLEYVYTRVQTHFVVPFSNGECIPPTGMLCAMGADAVYIGIRVPLVKKTGNQ